MFDLLCKLCSANVTIDSGPLHWAELWRLAERHRVAPLVIERIKQQDIPVPDDMAQHMAWHHQNNLYKGINQAAEVVRLTKLFQTHTIPFMLFKGIALTKLMGLELHQRHVGDMDLLLASVNDLWRADDLLQQLGYKRKLPPENMSLNTRQRQTLQFVRKDLIYFHPQKQIMLELHFKLYINFNVFPLSLAELFQNRTYITLGQVRIPVMSRQDHLLYLLVHGSISHWFCLKWLCDIPAISDNGKHYMHPENFDRMKALGLERMTSQGLYLANQLLGMPIHDEVRKYHRQNVIVPKLVRHAQKKLLAPAKSTVWLSPLTRLSSVMKDALYCANLRTEWQYKVTELIKIHWLNRSDWEKLTLPAPLFFLHYLLRPFIFLFR